MDFKKLMVLGTAGLAVVGSLTGAALASNRGAKAPSKPVAAVKVADTDNIQAGDQTSPDNARQATEASTLAAKAAAPGASTSSSSKARPVTNESENPGENPENSGESDGPGGHEDPPGQDVNNEFQGEQ